MKRNEWMALIATTILMLAVCLSASAKTKKTVERGMTKQEVIGILGQPKSLQASTLTATDGSSTR